MSFWQKLKQSFRSFMNGRHGADALSAPTLWLGLILYLLGAITGLGILTLLGFAAYVVMIFRMFSRNEDKRAAENRRYLAWKQRVTTKARQARNRFKNRKQYKYFKCPNCHAWLRLPRKAGVVSVTCNRCHSSFTQKA